MTFLVDAHQDLAYNMLTFGRDYRRSVAETRRLEEGLPVLQHTGHTLLGWPEYQAGQVGLIFSTLFLAPRRYRGGDWDVQSYASFDEARQLLRAQVALYRRLCDESPQAFQPIRQQAELKALLQTWQTEPSPHPVGLLLLMEGAEGIAHPYELAEWWQAGVRAIGLVWAGTRLCGGMHEGEGFTREGEAFLEVMADLGFTLDISHMNERSARQALERYAGPVIASHANARALLTPDNQRHLSDDVIRLLIERDGVMGILPFNRFLKATWKPGDPRSAVTLLDVVAHIDHVCQLAGDARHVAIGTDFDGGFGWPSVPQELDTIADLQKLAPLLLERGYSAEDVQNIFGGNWLRHLEHSLPE